jgi:hypothetical protein
LGTLKANLCLRECSANGGYIWPVLLNDSSRPHWGWLLFFLIGGLVLTGLTLFAESLDWRWSPAWQSVLVNVGTSMLFAAVLFMVEPRFTRRVVEAAGEGVTEKVQTVIRESTGKLTHRLDDLEALFDARREGEATVQRAAMAAMADQVTYETVSQAMDEANHVGAIRGGGLTVRGAESFKGPHVHFRYVRYKQPRPGRLQGQVALEISVKLAKRPDEFGTPVIECLWKPSMSVADVEAELRRRITESGYWEEARAFDFALAIREFTRGLDLALASTGSNGDKRSLNGPLDQIVDEEWAITEAGLECPSRKYIFPASEFPDQLYPGGAVKARRHSESQADAPSFRPPAPAFVDDELWEYLIQKGMELFPGRKLAFLATPSAIPYSRKQAT